MLWLLTTQSHSHSHCTKWPDNGNAVVSYLFPLEACVRLFEGTISWLQHWDLITGLGRIYSTDMDVWTGGVHNNFKGLQDIQPLIFNKSEYWSLVPGTGYLLRRGSIKATAFLIIREILHQTTYGMCIRSSEACARLFRCIARESVFKAYGNRFLEHAQMRSPQNVTSRLMFLASRSWSTCRILQLLR